MLPDAVMHRFDINNSLELKCLLGIEEDKLIDRNDGYCPMSFDKILCWPRTAPNTFAVLPCLMELNGVQYDSSNNATRYCSDNGEWAGRTNYDKCQHINSINKTCDEFDFNNSICTAYVTSVIYYVGYTISLMALVLAVIVFINFKDLRCLRNTIHINLFLTYILSIFLWILTLTLQMFSKVEDAGCILLAICFHYFVLTNFFWMLVEGLYLYMLVVQTFSGDNIRFNLYASIGWGGPAAFVLLWSILKAFSSEPLTESPKVIDLECSWIRESHIDWIIHAPACVVVVINLIFLIKIMWVLITKLRSANTIETRQYRKASKALLVLIPLLGTTYLVVIAGPDEGIQNHIFSILRAFLISIQGFSVALFFCFLNTEVRMALRHRCARWREERNLVSSHSIRNRRYTRDYSPRSRTESIRTTQEYTVFVKISEL